MLVEAAKQLEPLDAALARQTYLDAWLAALFAGQFAGAGSLQEVSRAARSAPPPAGAPRASDLLLDGFAVLVTEGHAKAAPLLRRAARVIAEDEITVEEGLRWGWMGLVAAVMVWDEDYWSRSMSGNSSRSARQACSSICRSACNRWAYLRLGVAIFRRLLRWSRKERRSRPRQGAASPPT